MRINNLYGLIRIWLTFSGHETTVKVGVAWQCPVECRVGSLGY